MNFVVAQTFSGSEGGFQNGNVNTFSGGNGGYRNFGPAYNAQFSNPNFASGSGYVSPSVYWPKYSREDCLERQDFVMQIAPGGCSPSVVTSDLLEEQNVPVFCKVQGLQVNPLIDVSRIRSLRFTGKYPQGVSSVSYYPARAALKSQQSLVGSPLIDNLGYLVIVLSRNAVENEMPDFVSGNITAVIDYDAEGAFGIGQTNFYLSETDDVEWGRDYEDFGFWNGKAYIRADSIDANNARISIYRDVDSRDTSVTLKKGETSKDIFLNGFYCAAGMNIKVEEIGAPVESALLKVNDKQIWVSNGDVILDSKCRVSNLDSFGGGGKLSVSCPVQNGKFDLSLNPGKANFGSGEKVVGEKINGNTYFAYSSSDSLGNYVVVISDGYSVTGNEFNDKGSYEIIHKIVSNDDDKLDFKVDDVLSKIEGEIRTQYKKKTNEKNVDEKVSIKILRAGESEFGVSLVESFSIKDRIWDLNDENERLTKEYYDEAIKNYQDLFDLYPSEQMPIKEEDTYAALGLYYSAQLSKEFELYETAQKFYSKLLREYPNSNIAVQVLREKELLTKYDSSNSKASVNINNKQYFMDLLDFKTPDKSDLSVVLLIDGKEQILGLNDVVSIESSADSSINTFKVMKVDDKFVSLQYSKSFSNASSSKSFERRVELSNDVLFENVNVKLVAVNLRKQVKVKISPKAYGPRTESSFSFNIGIEKRAIKLSPEKTRDIINNLEEVIERWEDINEKLGQVIKGLKGACFATSAVLNAKSLLAGFGGESMARNEIMTNTGGWNEKCGELVNNGDFSSIEQCLLENNDLIQKDIGIYTKEIEETNKLLEGIQDKYDVETSDILDLQGQVDSKKVEDEFAQEFNKFIDENDGVIKLNDADGTEINLKDMKNWSDITHEQRRELMTLFNAKQSADSLENGGSDTLKDMLGKKLGNKALEAKNFWDNEGGRKKALEEAQKYGLGVRTLTPFGDKVVYGDIKTIGGSETANVYKNFKQSDHVVRVFIPFKKSFAGGNFDAHPEVAGKEVIVKVVRTGKDYLPDTNSSIFTIDGNVLSANASASVRDYMSLAGMDKIRESDAKAYQNRMVNPENLKVKYFERAPYKGLPAEVPMDVIDGWYVELTYVLSGFGKPYDDSGRAVNYYICNVGENGLIEFKKSADDICRYYNAETGADLNFPGMSLSDSKRLISRAQQAISEAGRQYGQKRVSVLGNSFDSGIAFGGEEGRCSDFMSPQDCNIMFNVCDPVICPASRCDLGGKYRVDNVVQTGVIGSLTLCLPNFKEGVFVPICLTGVHAGLDNYMSILSSTRDCLQESLETGRNVGICDEIKSIYLCEFFWKQATPFINVLIPRVIESFYSQGVRGGGEYLTVQNAWANTEASINYFKNEYAVNSMQAFNVRSTEEVGGTICKNFVSSSYPTSANLFDKLVEPDSPVQYSAWFEEDILTSATIPSTSHYKVFYHIYAGKDQGAYYVVYLKDLPELNAVHSMNSYVVERGYIGKGGRKTEARDFSAVSGYKQLCVSINGQEKCGFKKVSTSYALNYMSDRFVEEQLILDIKGEEECIAGTPSAGSLINPNIQAGVEEVIQPELYNYGIIRVCSSQNPGKQVDARGDYDLTNSSYDRWKQVGYCDDPSIKCWVDTSSVKDVIKSSDIEEAILDEIDLSILGEGILDEDSSRVAADSAENEINNLIVNRGDSRSVIEGKISGIVSKLTGLANAGLNNLHRARGVYLLGRLHDKVARSIRPKVKVVEGSVDAGIVEEIEGEIEDLENVENDFESEDSSSENDNSEDSKNADEEETLPSPSDKRDFVMLEFQDGTRLRNSYYFYDSEDGWSWTRDPSYLNWLSANLEERGRHYDELNEKSKAFVRSLKDKDCDEGLRLLVSRAINDDEGGWFGNPALVIIDADNNKDVFDLNQNLNDVSCESVGII